MKNWNYKFIIFGLFMLGLMIEWMLTDHTERKFDFDY